MPDLFGGRPLSARTLARVGVAAVVGALVGAAGCTPDDPDTTATSSADSRTQSTPLPADPTQEHIDTAEAAYRNYVEVRDAVRQDHFRDWETKVLPLTTEHEAGWVASYFPQAVELGHYQVGANTVSNVTLAVDGYSEDPTGAGNERVTLEACLDTTNNVELGADGQDTDVPGSRGRFVVTVTVQHLTMFDTAGAAVEDPLGQSWWRVAKEDYDRERSC